MQRDELWKYRNMLRDINLKRERIKELWALAQRVTSCITADRVQGAGSSREISVVVDRIIDEENKIIQELGEAMKEEQRLYTAFESLEQPRDRELMVRRYLCGQKWEEISEKMHLSVSWAKAIHRNALEQVL